MLKIAALMTCHNRKEKTLACLNSLFKNLLPDGYSIEAFLVDDGSLDGTEQSVRERYPQVNIIKGDGNLYWNGGMRVAFAAAMKNDFDYYLWLNDDTLLYPDAIDKALNTAKLIELQSAAIIVGTTQESLGGGPTYGGFRRIGKGFSRKAELLVPQSVAMECEQMNGNCVLVPSQIAKKVGNLDKCFIHNLGDIDYGMRARAAGYKLLIMPGYAGTCSKNEALGTHLDTKIGLRQRLTKVFSKKTFPLIPWLIFTKRYGGPLWFLYWIKPYFDVLASTFRR